MQKRRKIRSSRSSVTTAPTTRPRSSSAWRRSRATSSSPSPPRRASAAAHERGPRRPERLAGSGGGPGGQVGGGVPRSEGLGDRPPEVGDPLARRGAGEDQARSVGRGEASALVQTASLGRSAGIGPASDGSASADRQSRSRSAAADWPPRAACGPALDHAPGRPRARRCQPGRRPGRRTRKGLRGSRGWSRRRARRSPGRDRQGVEEPALARVGRADEDDSRPAVGAVTGPEPVGQAGDLGGGLVDR